MIRPVTSVDPLERVDITVEVDGFVAGYEITQHFVNRGTVALEAVFTFPVPHGAVLVGIEARVADQRLNAMALPGSAAEAGYAEAIAGGDTAILVKEVSPGLLCLSLGQLAPGETGTLVYRFAQLLEGRGDGLTLRIPTTVAPRYGRPAMAAHEVPEVALDLVRRAGLRVRVRDGAADWRVASPTHELVATARDGDLVIEPSAGTVVMDRDIVITLTGVIRPCGLTLSDGELAVAVARFRPEGEGRRAGGRMLKILVDCSGSMAGTAMEQARVAVVEILRALTPEDLVSLTRFGTAVEGLTDGLVAATPDLVERMMAVVGTIKADLGGTELRRALIATFAQARPTGSTVPADLLLLTDGETWDDQGIAAVARVSGHRVFTIGVGFAAAETPLRALAELTGGACDIVAPREGMVERVVRQVARMDAHAMRAEVSWPAEPVAVWPRRLGPVFPGDTVHVAAWFAREPSGEAILTVSSEGRSQRQAAPLARRADPLAEPLRRLLGHHRVRETADETAATTLAVDYGLLSPYTHLLMVAERGGKLAGAPARRRVASMLAADWGGGRVAPAPALAGGWCDIAFEVAPPCDGRDDGAPGHPGLCRGPSVAERLRRVLDAAPGLAAIGFAELREAGVSGDLCDQLRALLMPGASEAEIVLCLLQALMAATPGGPVPAALVPAIRAALEASRAANPGHLDDVLAAVEAIATGHDGWGELLVG